MIIEILVHKPKKSESMSENRAVVGKKFNLFFYSFLNFLREIDFHEKIQKHKIMFSLPILSEKLKALLSHTKIH